MSQVNCFIWVSCKQTTFSLKICQYVRYWTTISQCIPNSWILWFTHWTFWVWERMNNRNLYNMRAKEDHWQLRVEACVGLSYALDNLLSICMNWIDKWFKGIDKLITENEFNLVNCRYLTPNCIDDHYKGANNYFIWCEEKLVTSSVTRMSRMRSMNLLQRWRILHAEKWFSIQTVSARFGSLMVSEEGLLNMISDTTIASAQQKFSCDWMNGGITRW